MDFSFYIRRYKVTSICKIEDELSTIRSKIYVNTSNTPQILHNYFGVIGTKFFALSATPSAAVDALDVIASAVSFNCIDRAFSEIDSEAVAAPDLMASAACFNLASRIRRTYAKRTTKSISILSLIIINIPWTKSPFRICGPIPLNRARGPSRSMMCFMTSPKVLKGLPFRSGGGLDCRPTFATING